MKSKLSTALVFAAALFYCNGIPSFAAVVNNQVSVKVDVERYCARPSSTPAKPPERLQATCADAAIDEALSDIESIARKMSSGGIPSGDISLIFPSGLIRIGSYIDVTRKHIPPAPYRLTLQGGDNLTTVITASQSVTLSELRGKVAVYTDARLRNIDWVSPPQVYVNGELATLARTPNAGDYYYADSIKGAPDKKDATSEWRLADEDDTAAAAPRDLISVFQVWSLDRYRIRDIALTGHEKRVSLSQPLQWKQGKWGLQRYFYENRLIDLDVPGEWVGADTSISYIAEQSGPPPEAIEVATGYGILRISGEPGNKVERVRVTNLAFRRSTFSVPSSGYVDRQASYDLPAALELKDAEDIKIEGCNFDQVGAYAIGVGSGSANVSILGNRITRSGAGGIKVGVAKDEGIGSVRKITIMGNNIEFTGILSPGGVDIWIGNAYAVSVIDNKISNTKYSGISVGWTWGFGGALGGGHLIEGNTVSQVGDGTLSDLGGIYLLGPLPGTIVRHNLIHSISSGKFYNPGQGMGGWGIYLDEGSSDISLKDNFIYAAESAPLYVHQSERVTFSGGYLVAFNTPAVVVKRGRNKYFQLDMSGVQICLDGDGIWYRGPLFSENIIASDLSIESNCRADAPEIDRMLSRWRRTDALSAGHRARYKGMN